MPPIVTVLEDRGIKTGLYWHFNGIRVSGRSKAYVILHACL